MMVRIWSIEHSKWWKPSGCGYTADRNLAGLYSMENAIEICRDANNYRGSHNPPNEAIVPIGEPRHATE